MVACAVSSDLSTQPTVAPTAPKASAMRAPIAGAGPTTSAARPSRRNSALVHLSVPLRAAMLHRTTQRLRLPKINRLDAGRPGVVDASLVTPAHSRSAISGASRQEKIVMAPNTLLPTAWPCSRRSSCGRRRRPAANSRLTEIAVAEFVVIRLSLAAVALWLIVLRDAHECTAAPSSAGARWSCGIAGAGPRHLPGFWSGLTMTSPVSGSVFWGLTPLIVPILGRVVLGERIEIVVLVAAVIAFSGTADPGLGPEPSLAAAACSATSSSPAACWPLPSMHCSHGAMRRPAPTRW